MASSQNRFVVPGTFRSYGASPRDALAFYKHFTPTGFDYLHRGLNKHFILAGLRVAALLLVVASMGSESILAQRSAAPTRQPSGKLVEAKPESVGVSSERLAKIDEAVLESISRKETPGAVVLLARKGRVVYRKAFGDRAIEPKREPMTVDTIFDLASLTKIVATATSMMILVERGKVSLADPVALYIPEFGEFGKERVTVEQLMTHRAGLPP
ncbi:MAG TPA: serine hydrolase domain-containing protein, partial [Blastocatellia bacterium]